MNDISPTVVSTGTLHLQVFVSRYVTSHRWISWN
jgi:hypothetical protein